MKKMPRKVRKIKPPDLRKVDPPYLISREDYNILVERVNLLTDRVFGRLAAL